MKQEKVIAVDIGASKIRAQTVDREGNCGEEYSASLLGINPDNVALMQIIYDLVDKVTKDEKETSFAAISVASPGSLDTHKGIIQGASGLSSIDDLPIVENLNARYGLPTYLLNDAAAAGLGEYWLGAGKNCPNMFYITLSSGVGGSHIINGALQLGLGEAPEVGHTDLSVTDDYHRKCKCGQPNHAESFLGTYGLSITYAHIFKQSPDMTPDEQYSVSPKMREGVVAINPQWLALQKKYSEHLAQFLRNIILNFQPKLIILGGGIALGNSSLLTDTESSLKSLMDPQQDKIADMAVGVKLTLANLQNSGIVGAAKHAFDQIKKE